MSWKGMSAMVAQWRESGKRKRMTSHVEVELTRGNYFPHNGREGEEETRREEKTWWWTQRKNENRNTFQVTRYLPLWNGGIAHAGHCCTSKLSQKTKKKEYIQQKLTKYLWKNKKTGKIRMRISSIRQLIESVLINSSIQLIKPIGTEIFLHLIRGRWAGPFLFLRKSFRLFFVGLDFYANFFFAVFIINFFFWTFFRIFFIFAEIIIIMILCFFCCLIRKCKWDRT